jgi:hypothetical protein
MSDLNSSFNLNEHFSHGQKSCGCKSNTRCGCKHNSKSCGCKHNSKSCGCKHNSKSCGCKSNTRCGCKHNSKSNGCGFNKKYVPTGGLAPFKYKTQCTGCKSIQQPTQIYVAGGIASSLPDFREVYGPFVQRYVRRPGENLY